MQFGQNEPQFDMDFCLQWRGCALLFRCMELAASLLLKLQGGALSEGVC